MYERLGVGAICKIALDGFSHPERPGTDVVCVARACGVNSWYQATG